MESDRVSTKTVTEYERDQLGRAYNYALSLIGRHGLTTVPTKSDRGLWMILTDFLTYARSSHQGVKDAIWRCSMRRDMTVSQFPDDHMNCFLTYLEWEAHSTGAAPAGGRTVNEPNPNDKPRARLAAFSRTNPEEDDERDGKQLQVQVEDYRQNKLLQVAQECAANLLPQGLGIG